MKSVLISIKPQWCEKIASGRKTIEVRKSAPKETPFKCYIYCCKDNVKEIVLLKDYKNRFSFGDYRNADGHFYDVANRTVIGEFICDKVDKYTFSSYEAEYRVNHIEQEMMCLNHPDLIRYGGGEPLCGWHISNLKIYDKPKELSEFYTIDESGSDCCCGCVYHETPLEEMPCKTCTGERRYLYRPPQSWMYVKEI
nr:MAG TPA: helix-turn-helix domain-containing protein [Caudoviricetes sp.]